MTTPVSPQFRGKRCMYTYSIFILHAFDRITSILCIKTLSVINSVRSLMKQQEQIIIQNLLKTTEILVCP